VDAVGEEGSGGRTAGLLCAKTPAGAVLGTVGSSLDSVGCVSDCDEEG